jgi:hypothetical protein
VVVVCKETGVISDTVPLRRSRINAKTCQQVLNFQAVLQCGISRNFSSLATAKGAFQPRNGAGPGRFVVTPEVGMETGSGRPLQTHLLRSATLKNHAQFKSDQKNQLPDLSTNQKSRKS